jgi:hypothetical protein
MTVKVITNDGALILAGVKRLQAGTSGGTVNMVTNPGFLKKLDTCKPAERVSFSITTLIYAMKQIKTRKQEILTKRQKGGMSNRRSSNTATVDLNTNWCRAFKNSQCQALTSRKHGTL